jgi:nucleotide-binding universal stress UspA family protein
MSPVSRILCAVDFSEGSRHALDRAVGLARLFGASISVLYVHHVAVPVPVASYAGVVLPLPLSDAARGDIQQSLSEFVADDRRAGAAIDTLFDEDLVVPRAIVQTAAHTRADLIVIGTHGQSGFTRLILGSVAAAVMRSAARPVLLVPPHAGQAVPLSLARIVCPIDFSAVSRAALEFARSLATAGAARLSVMHVVDVSEDDYDDVEELPPLRGTRFDRARSALETALADLRDDSTVDPLLLAGKPYREILRVAAEQQADAVVIGVQGKGAADAAGFGSTAFHVVRQAPCAVLTIPGN